jgi:hypothetical protein
MPRDRLEFWKIIIFVFHVRHPTLDYPAHRLNLRGGDGVVREQMPLQYFLATDLKGGGE